MMVFFFVGATCLANGQNSPLWKIANVDRQVLFDNVAYYRFDVVVGPGQYDKIRIHRIVQETQPFQPKQLAQAVMFFGGEPTYFATLYVEPLIDPDIVRDRSIAIYLAKNNIDVWGMDYRWALVPQDAKDLSFMKNWGIETDVQDAQTALTIARLLRGNGFAPSGPLYLAGLSYGAKMTYAVAADDTQRPLALRNVKGIIPLDCGVKFKEPEVKAEACTNFAADQQNLKSGVYYYDNTSLWQMGDLALSNPGGTSPFDSTLTNYQFGLVVGTSPNGAIPWHFVGGWMDSNGIPYDLRYTEPSLWFDLLKFNEPPYSPIRLDYDSDSVECGKHLPDVTFANHLSDITIPVFYVGAAGGFGTYGEYTTKLVASRDVTVRIVQEQPDDMRSVDYGHGDLLAGRKAELLVWQPILQWLQNHH